MANQPLAFAELLAGGVLVASALTGSSVADVVAGKAGPFKGFSIGGSGSNSSNTSNTTSGTASGAATGTANFEGHTVAAWMLPALQYARAHGWKGQILSGYRSDAQQVAIWNSGKRPAAKPVSLGGPGSEHSLTTYPGGAVDVSNPLSFISALAGFSGLKPIQATFANDPGHFSGNGH